MRRLAAAFVAAIGAMLMAAISTNNPALSFIGGLLLGLGATQALIA